mmetsp:Transcript_76107/g.183924  ORF Transcript_76107/g.183924 Transcript_76107/m.183924 type:complete len:262 (-) Transcript_76107:12-797(-)
MLARSPSTAASRTTAHDHLKILAAVDYDSMEIFGVKRCAVKLSKGSGDWVRFDKDTSSQYALCCWVAKNLTGPQIEFPTQAPEEHASSAAAHRRLSMITSNTYAEAVASLSFMSSSKSGIDLNVGAGVSTGGGIKDDSVSVKLLGCGVVVGRKIGISLFDNSIVFDLGKIAESARSPTSTRTAGGGKRDFCFSLSGATVSKLDLAQAGSDQVGEVELACTPRGTPLYTPRGTATGAYEEFVTPVTSEDVKSEDQPASGVVM